MDRVVNFVKKLIWNTAVNSKLSYSRYGMFEPKKSKNFDKYL